MAFCHVPNLLDIERVLAHLLERLQPISLILFFGIWVIGFLHFYV